MIMHIVGNRPQFIKLAPVSRALRAKNIEEIIIHTGQHYDENMSDIFFEELEIPMPVRNLNAGSGTHAQVTAKVMTESENVLLEFAPEAVVLYGDTNSTLGAAIAAAKLNIPIIHVEAGTRSGSRKNPEEINRILVDHVSDICCTPDRISVQDLLREGISEDRIHFTGDVMYDEFLWCASQKSNSVLLNNLPNDFILMTWHRQENTSSKERMEKIIDFIGKVGFPIVFPVHPRTRKLLREYELEDKLSEVPDLTLLEPLGYKEMVSLLNKCRLCISDSGGLSKEASFAGRKCIYILDLRIWPELIDAGAIQLMDVENEASVHNALQSINDIINGDEEKISVDFFGDGHAALQIADIIMREIY